MKHRGKGDCDKTEILKKGDYMRIWMFHLTDLLAILFLSLALTALLVPALSRAQTAAKSNSCIDNLARISKAWSMYLADNGSTYQDRATALTGYQRCWAAVLEKQYVKDPLCWKCAAAPEYEETMIATAGGDVDEIGSSVSLSALQYGYYGYNSTGFGGVRLEQLRNPKQKILIGDTAKLKQPNNAAGGYDYKKLTWSTLYSLASSDGVPDSRHAGKAVLGWADGHVSEETNAAEHYSQVDVSGAKISLSDARNLWWNPLK